MYFFFNKTNKLNMFKKYINIKNIFFKEYFLKNNIKKFQICFFEFYMVMI